MRIAICQSNYLPWRGYFDMIASVDTFIFHDDIQYTKQDWRNRNVIKARDGLKWLTVPVRKAPVDTPVDRIEIDNSRKAEWIWHHRQALEAAYSKAPYWSEAMSLFSHTHGAADEPWKWWGSLSAMNQHLTLMICEYLGIKTALVDARSLSCVGRKTEKIAALLSKASILYGSGTQPVTYLSGPAARQYLDVDALRTLGVSVEWKDYNYEPYQQQFGDFAGNVSILDLIANLGPDARNHITSIPEQEPLHEAYAG